LNELVPMPLDLPKCDVCEKNDIQVVTCIKCDLNFCKTCDQKHHSTGKLKEHKREIYSGVDLPSRFCIMKSHEKQPLALFCENCSKLICGLCSIEEHKTHTCVRAEVAAENAKGILKDAVIPLQEMVTQAEIEIKISQEKIQKEEEKIKENKKKMDENLQKIEDIKSLLNKNQVDSFLLLSMVSNLKLENPRRSNSHDYMGKWWLCVWRLCSYSMESRQFMEGIKRKFSIFIN